MCSILLFPAFIFISDAKLQRKESPNDIGHIEVDLGFSASIKCNIPTSEYVHNSSDLKVVT